MRWKCLFVCLMAACLLTSCTLLPEEEAVRTAPVTRSYVRPEYSTAAVERGDLIHSVKISCSYVPVQTASLSFALDDEYIDRFLVQAGDSVKAGQVLAQLQLGDLQERIAAAQTEAAVLEMRLTHEKKQYDLNLKRLEITTAQMDALQKAQALEKARESYTQSVRSLQDLLTFNRLTLEALNSELAKRQIRAPFDGTVTRVTDFEEGDKSEFGIGVLTLVDSTRSIFHASTEYWDRFTPGEVYWITVKKEDYEAVVVSEEELGLAPQARETGKRSYVYFALTRPSFELKDGDTGTVEMVVDQRLNVLHVPAGAVSAAGGRPIVYELREDGMKTYRYVETGVTIDGRTEIISGLEKGESVIVKGGGNR